MENLNKISMKLFLMLAIMASVAFTGCEEEGDVATPQFPELKEVAATVGESLDITFSANLDWTIKSDAAWCKFVNGEFKETTASGKAGDQILKVEISDESWNYTSDDVAQITLTMGSLEQVIYKVTRGAREYMDLVVTNEQGDVVYDETHPLIVKGNNSNVVYTVLKASAEAGVEIGVDHPDWLTLVKDKKTKTYQFTFNKEAELDERFPFSNESDVISFFTRDAETAETDKVRKVNVHVSYDGFDSSSLIIGTTYPDLKASYDGVLETNTGSVNSVSTKVIASSNDFVILEGTQTKNGDAYVYDFGSTADLDWVTVTNPNEEGEITLSVTPNDSEEERSAIVLLLPRKLADECGIDYNDYLLIGEGEVDDEGNPLVAGELRSKFSTFMMAAITQNKLVEAQDEISFTSRAISIDGEFLMLFADAELSNLVSSKVEEGSELDAIKAEYPELSDISNIWKMSVPVKYTGMGVMTSMPMIVEAVGMGTEQTMSKVKDVAGIQCSEYGFQGNIGTATGMEAIYGLALSGSTITDHYDIAVKDNDGKIISFCRLVFEK